MKLFVALYMVSLLIFAGLLYADHNNLIPWAKAAQEQRRLLLLCFLAFIGLLLSPQRSTP